MSPDDWRQWLRRIRAELWAHAVSAGSRRTILVGLT